MPIRKLCPIQTSSLEKPEAMSGFSPLLRLGPPPVYIHWDCCSPTLRKRTSLPFPWQLGQLPQYLHWIQHRLRQPA